MNIVSVCGEGVVRYFSEDGKVGGHEVIDQGEVALLGGGEVG